MLFVSLLLASSLSGMDNDADSTFTDYKPEYKQWQTNYIIDKIEYSNSETVIYFRFFSAYGGGNITYYAPGVKEAWFLHDAKSGRSIEILELRNLAIDRGIRNPILIKNSGHFVVDQKVGEIHTCEIVFPRLPLDMESMSLIEGKGNEKSEIHFNVLDIKIKTRDSKELGSKAELKARLEAEFKKAEQFKIESEKRENEKKGGK